MRELTFRCDIEEEARRVFELRELLRGNKHEPMPSGRHGFIVEDLDLIIRWYGPLYNLDEWGRFRYVEVKRKGASLRTAQEKTFGMAHSFCAERPDRYDGFYLVTHDNDKHDETTTYTVNDHQLSCNEFLTWMLAPWSPIPSRRYFEVPLLIGPSRALKEA